MIVGRHSSRSSGVLSPESNMQDTISFHIYKGDEVVSHNLSIEELEEFLVKRRGHLHSYEIVAVAGEHYDEASF